MKSEYNVLNFLINMNILYIFIITFLFSCQSSSLNSVNENNGDEDIEPDYTTIPLLIGTRGMFNPEDHEHSISALIQAPPWVDGVYFNIRMTTDGVPVLMHDFRVDRTTDGTGPINTLTLEEVQALDAGGGEPVVTLEQYLQAILNRESLSGRRPFSRIFLNPRAESIEAISEMYSIAMDPKFSSLADRYTWQFNDIVENNTGAVNLRSLDETVKIGTFLSEPDYVKEVINVMESVNGNTILMWPNNYKSNKETLQKIKDSGFESGLSRISPPYLDVIPIAHDDPNVKVLYTWYTNELSWWYPDE